LKIAHIINPFIGSEEHKNIQNITFESLRRAQADANNCEVEIVAVYYKEDEACLPDFITKRAVLEKSVLDYNSNLKERKLPTLKDILEQGAKAVQADYLVYSNIDIGVQPNFYQSIPEFVNQGYDAFVINRRRISAKYTSVDQLNQIYAEAGEIHNGYDCFVFKQSLMSQFNLGNVCVGIPHVGNSLFFNLMCFADNLKLFTDKNLTFHIGFELIRNWGSAPFINHNKTEYNQVIKTLKPQLKMSNLPGSGLSFCKRHVKWIMNPTIPYPVVMGLDFKASKDDRYQQSGKKLKGYYEWLQKKIKLD
jgi:hypothetical protein